MARMTEKCWLDEVALVDVMNSGRFSFPVGARRRGDCRSNFCFLQTNLCFLKS